MRGFLGFAVSEAFSAELHATTVPLPVSPKLSLLPLSDYHVTIKFLSEFSSTNFLSCLPELTALGHPPLQGLRAGRIELWPTVLALECEPPPELIRWHAEVNTLLERHGFLRERHPRYHPHITLARRREGWRLPEIEAALSPIADRFLGRAVPLERPALWRTEPDGTGRRHMPFLSPLSLRR